VAVARDTFAVGVAGATDDWRAPKGSAANERLVKGGLGISADYQVIDLGNALAADYRTDAHLVAYVLRDATGTPLRAQPRVNKPGLAFVRSLGYSVALEALFADIDNAAHCEWSPELLELAIVADRKLATAGVYYTTHGRRVVQPLSRPVDVDQAEGVLAGWLAELERLGLHADPACRDWTRHFRLPNVRRAGQAYRSPRVDLERMQPIDPPAPALVGKWARRSSTVIGDAGPVDEAALAMAFAAAGWLGPGLGRGKRAALCPWRAEHSGGADFDSSTILFGATPRNAIGWWHCSHAHCARRTQAEVIRALPAQARRLIPEAPAAPTVRPDALPVAEARERLENAFRTAPDGLSVVVAGCGTGKTEAALVVARERAARTHATPGEHVRAPAHSKTAISVPTTKLAHELAERVRAAGGSVRRLFGPLSVKRSDGSPECRYHDAATALAAGRLSVPWELCRGRDREPCGYADVCTAFDGADGPSDARILIGPHALLGQLTAEAGGTGLLVIDEPPAVLTHEVLTVEQLVATEARLGHFDGRYASALRVSLRALAAWIASGPLEEPGPLARGVERVDEALLDEAFEVTGQVDAVAAAQAAFPVDHKGPHTPPVRREAIFSARRSLAIAQAIGAASRVLWLVWSGLAGPERSVVARIEERRDQRVLVLSCVDMQLIDALRREGACVVADANGRIHLPVYERAVGYAPHVTEAHAADGARVERTLLQVRATRRAWMPSGRLEASRGLTEALRGAVDWALEQGRPGRIALVTIKPLELALRAALGEDVTEAWVEAGQTLAALPELRQTLAPELRRLPPRLDLGHYGALRGLDEWKGHDALITLGDPWIRKDDAAHEAQYLGLPAWETRYEALCAAELEQAHGRLRTVHRTKPARALHVGAVMPSGWRDVETREAVAAGRPRNEPTATPERLADAVRRLGGPSEAARRAGLGRATLARYLSGDRGCPPDVLASLLRLAPREGWSSAS